MKPLLLILVLLLAANSANCQKSENELDKLIIETRNKMAQNNIKEYLIYTSSHNTRAINEDENGNYIGTVDFLYFDAYIFWRENSKCYARLVDSNHPYKTVEIANCDFLNISQKEIDKMSKETIPPVEELFEGQRSQLITSNDSFVKFYFKDCSLPEFYQSYLSDLKKSDLNYNLKMKLLTTKLYQTCEKIVQTLGYRSSIK